MKRSSSAPCLADEDHESKRVKSKASAPVPNTREYLQLALARVLELQREIKDDTYMTGSTSDLGESDTEEDLMKEVLNKVFKDLPGSSSSVSAIINKAIKPPPAQLEIVRGKSIQLSGYDTCRKVALDFMKSVVKGTQKPLNKQEFHVGTYSMIEAKMASRRTGLLNGSAISSREMQSTRNLPTDYEVRVRMLRGLDLHLAAKQRDYTAKLMRF